MSGDGITSDEFASIGGPAVEGTLMTFPPDPRTNPNAADVVKKFRDAGFEPEAYTLYSYAAVQVIAEGIKRAGSLDPQAVAAKLRGGDPVDHRDRRHWLRRQGRHHPSGLRDVHVEAERGRQDHLRAESVMHRPG